MTVLVLGGSSQIGHFLLPRLYASGEATLAISRVARVDQPGVAWIYGDLPNAMPQALPALSAIISFGPLLPFAQWLAQAPLANQPRVVATSSMSALSKADSAVPAEQAIARTLREGERALAQTCDARGLGWTVLRPTLVYGCGRDKSLTPIAQRALRTRLFPLPAGNGLRQPVHADDIAQAALLAMQRPSARGQVLALGGGERLSAAHMFARVRASLPVTTLPLPIPASALRLAQRLLPPLRGVLARLETDLIADNGPLEQTLSLRPRPFQPDATCWQRPPDSG